MAEFSDAGLWVKVAFLLATLGKVLILFAFAMGVGTHFNEDSIDAVFVIAIICWIVGIVLLMCMVFLDELKDNKIVKIVTAVLFIVAGVMTVIGIAIWGGKFDDNKSGTNDDPPAISTTIAVFAALMAILAGIFIILDVAGVGSGGGGK